MIPLVGLVDDRQSPRGACDSYEAACKMKKRRLITTLGHGRVYLNKRYFGQHSRVSRRRWRKKKARVLRGDVYSGVSRCGRLSCVRGNGVLRAFLSSLYGLAHPPTTSTHSARQLPSLPSTSTMSVSQRHRQPTPFSFGGSHSSQYLSSSRRFRSSTVVISRKGSRGSWRAGALAGQC